MCGITVAYSSSLEKRESFIYKGLDLIAHRGSDEISRCQFGERLFLGHRRLSITGKKGSQPMVNNRVAILTNGEFYDYKKIKKKFASFNFKTDSDAEILIPLYEKYGIFKMMKYLNGEFAFVLIDHSKKEIYLAKDMIGNKPLYYYKDENDLFISSEIKSFKSIINLEFDNDVLMQKLAMQYHYPYDTLFKGIKQVEAGTILTFNYETGTIKINRYTELYQEKNNTYSPQKMFKLLKQSVKRRIEDQNPAITLSGGLDSSIILDLVQEINPQIKTCFSISFKDGGVYDEQLLVEQLQQKYNLNLNIISLTAKDLMDNFEESIIHAEDVAVNMHVAAKFLLFKEIKKQGYRVSLSGEGSDEFFFGYSHFYPQKNDYLVGMHLPDETKDEFTNLPLFLQAKLSIGCKIQKFLNQKNNFIYKYNIPSEKISELEKSSFLWSKMALSNSILLALGDKMEMASTIEGRTPFLDKDVLKYIMSIPLNEKYNENTDKILLRRLFQKRLPIEIVEKRKHPFISPPLLALPEGILFYKKILNEWKNPLINNDAINEKLEELAESKDQEQARLFDPVFMILSSLAIIQKRMIENE